MVINLILAVLCERTVDTGHCLRHSNKYYRMLNQNGMQVHYRMGTKVMFIQAYDGCKYCCINDKEIYAQEEIPEHEAKSKKLAADYKRDLNLCILMKVTRDFLFMADNAYHFTTLS